ncbi:MAG: hypothetical protein JWM20_262 [Patescibacteria group bacterium]|nr:hypothetical protein [Patescibacteria group bacterium]
MNIFGTKKIDFLAIGDVTTDTFIRLKNAAIACDANNECTISMPWGAKLSYDFAIDISGVGNAANAAVSAARIGLKTAFLSHAGKDHNGDTSVSALDKEGISTKYIKRTDGASNHDFVLWEGPERTILVKHESSNYELPSDLPVPRYVYLSSVGDSSGTFHAKLADWLTVHPEIVFAFQPGRELADGFDVHKHLYERANICIMNKEEAEGLLKLGETDMKDLLKELQSKTSKLVFITDGPKGAYSFDGTQMLYIPMYPDPKPPYDRTGAGDAFASTVVSAHALGIPLESAMTWGPINSMSVVQAVGAQNGLLSREKIEEFLKNAPTDYKIKKIP